LGELVRNKPGETRGAKPPFRRPPSTQLQLGQGPRNALAQLLRPHLLLDGRPRSDLAFEEVQEVRLRWITIEDIF